MTSETHINRKQSLWNTEVNFVPWKGIFNFSNKNLKQSGYIAGGWLLTSGTVVTAASPMFVCIQALLVASPTAVFLHLSKRTECYWAAVCFRGSKPLLSPKGQILTSLLKTHMINLFLLPRVVSEKSMWCNSAKFGIVLLFFKITASLLALGHCEVGCLGLWQPSCTHEACFKARAWGLWSHGGKREHESLLMLLNCWIGSSEAPFLQTFRFDSETHIFTF